ncbi:MAG: hypothetical protein K2O84_11660, partial [Oscillospiraceae bacterium]|nr:hypothetical protein [Oscillospiraceae bacterium]
SYLPCPSKKSLAFGHSAIYQTSPRPHLGKSCRFYSNLLKIFLKNIFPAAEPSAGAGEIKNLYS